MTLDFNKKSLLMFMLVGMTLSWAYPAPESDDGMVHNNNYDMIMMDEAASPGSMHMQNFDEFYKAEDNDAMDAMEMAESRTYMVRAPLPLSAKFEDLDVQHEKRVQRSLAKGAAMPLSNANDWEKFDYEMLLNNQQ